jgi:hypothetical protein
MRATLAAILLCLTTPTLPASAADKALILTDQEQAAYIAIMDAAIKQSGLSQISRNAIVLADKLYAAGVVTNQQTIPDPPKADPPKTKEGTP